MGGGNANQTVQFVRSYNPRGWTCLHIVEGPYTCTNTLVQNNDIGPCGVDTFQEWADGISVSCRDSIVRNNMIHGATDGGIVLFGSPGTQVYNNTIWITNVTMILLVPSWAHIISRTPCSAASTWLTISRGRATSQTLSFEIILSSAVSPRDQTQAATPWVRMKMTCSSSRFFYLLLAAFVANLVVGSPLPLALELGSAMPTGRILASAE